MSHRYERRDAKRSKTDAPDSCIHILFAFDMHVAKL